VPAPGTFVFRNPVIHCSLLPLSWAVRLGVPLDLPSHAAALLKASHWFDGFGAFDGGPHVILDGTARSGAPVRVSWFIVGRDGDRPCIPTIPAVLMVEKIKVGAAFGGGTMPCVGIICVREYPEALQPLKIRAHESERH
jgi:hypothetical protein